MGLDDHEPRTVFHALTKIKYRWYPTKMALPAMLTQDTLDTKTSPMRYYWCLLSSFTFVGTNWDNTSKYILFITPLQQGIPDCKVHGAYMGPIWDRQDPDGPHVGPMNFAIWDAISSRSQACALALHTSAIFYDKKAIAIVMIRYWLKYQQAPLRKSKSYFKMLGYLTFIGMLSTPHIEFKLFYSLYNHNQTNATAMALIMLKVSLLLWRLFSSQREMCQRCNSKQAQTSVNITYYFYIIIAAYMLIICRLLKNKLISFTLHWISFSALESYGLIQI